MYHEYSIPTRFTEDYYMSRCQQAAPRNISLSSCAVLVAIAASFFFTAQAATIAITAPAVANSTAQVAGPCTIEQGGTAPGCGSHAFVDTNVASSTSGFYNAVSFNGAPNLAGKNFSTAFSTWNAANGNNWTLIDAGNLLDVKFNVSQFNATATQTLGGLQITVNLQNYKPGANDPTIGQLVWSQGLAISFRPPNGLTTSPPFNTMDSFSFNQFAGGCDALPGAPNANNNTTPSSFGANPSNGYCDPVYPFQNAAKDFGDAPKGSYALDSFRGIAMLSTVTFKTNNVGAIIERDLTVYGGVNYGFDVFVVPEPSTVVLLIAGAVMMAAMRLRKSSAVSSAQLDS
jgi:hypothetical protein